MFFSHCMMRVKQRELSYNIISILSANKSYVLQIRYGSQNKKELFSGQKWELLNAHCRQTLKQKDSILPRES